MVFAYLLTVSDADILEAGMGAGRFVRKFCSDESGATAIEYALIASGISIVIVIAVQTIGTTLTGTFSTVSTSLK
jgi:pilus assembly protein Flp/PilA